MNELPAQIEKAKPPAPEKERRRRVPRKIKQAIEALVSGEAKNITRAAEVAELSREHLSRQLSLPHVRSYFQEKVARAVALSSGRAAARLVELLDSESSHVSMDAVRLSLGIAGLRPAPEANVNVSVDIKAGYVIDLGGYPEPTD